MVQAALLLPRVGCDSNPTRARVLGQDTRSAEKVALVQPHPPPQPTPPGIIPGSLTHSHI